MTWRFGWWRLQVELRDDGAGMPVDLAATGKHGHMGLASMRERAQTLGATLRIASAPDKGTTVALTMRASKGYAA